MAGVEQRATPRGRKDSKQLPSFAKDLLSYQMLELQKRINQMTDEDLLSPNAQLALVSPSAPLPKHAMAAGAGGSAAPPGASPFEPPPLDAAELRFAAPPGSGSLPPWQAGPAPPSFASTGLPQPPLLLPPTTATGSVVSAVHPVPMSTRGSPAAAGGGLGLSVTGMGALEALSAFLGAPPSRSASLHEAPTGPLLPSPPLASTGSAAPLGPGHNGADGYAGPGAYAAALAGGGSSAGQAPGGNGGAVGMVSHLGSMASGLWHERPWTGGEDGGLCEERARM